jgi:hypothetical protein
MIDQLASIGIEKGKPFNPDARTKNVLDDAAREAHAWLVARYQASLAPYYEGGHWARPGSRELFEGQASFFAKPDVYPVDVRGVTFSYAYFTPKHVGAGSSYLLTIADKDGHLLDGGTTYHLNVPAHAPVKQYWSATVYDRATHAPIRNARWPSRSSQTPGLQKNGDGSVDVYFGPAAPAGKESNWVPTSTGSGFEVLFRFYGPEKPLFEKTWRLPDIERVSCRTSDRPGRSAPRSRFCCRTRGSSAASAAPTARPRQRRLSSRARSRIRGRGVRSATRCRHARHATRTRAPSAAGPGVPAGPR